MTDELKAVVGVTQDMSVCPGVRVEDMGHKMGCNGVDNGKLWFNGEQALRPTLPVHTGRSSCCSFVLGDQVETGCWTLGF